MNPIYRFAVASTRSPLADPEHTLGIEVTSQHDVVLCNLGHIDPQHGLHRYPEHGDGSEWPACVPGDAACSFALRVPLPPDGSTLATTRADCDSIAAMAVLVLRGLGLGPSNGLDRAVAMDLVSRVTLIAERDGFRPRSGARPPLPTVAQPWSPEDAPGSVDSSHSLRALGVLCSPNPRQGQTEYPLTVRVAVMACWLLHGSQFDGADYVIADRIRRACGAEDMYHPGNVASRNPSLGDTYRACQHAADAARLDLARALADGRMTVWVDAPERCEVLSEMEERGLEAANRWAEPIAIVRGEHVGAMGVGYSQADVVVAEMVDPRDSVCSCTAAGFWHAQDCPAGFEERPPPRKLTIAWCVAGVVERDTLCAALNAAEVVQNTADIVEAERGCAGADGTDFIGQANDHLIAVRSRRATWGGGATILGSPQGGSVLPLDEVVRIVRSAMGGA